jgi:hypothetical protein
MLKNGKAFTPLLEKLCFFHGWVSTWLVLYILKGKRLKGYKRLGGRHSTDNFKIFERALISNFSCISEQIIKGKNYRVRVDLLAIEQSLARVLDKDKIISAHSISDCILSIL